MLDNVMYKNAFELRAEKIRLVETFLKDNPGWYTPKEIGKAVGRSAGTISDLMKPSTDGFKEVFKGKVISDGKKRCALYSHIQHHKKTPRPFPSLPPITGLQTPIKKNLGKHRREIKDKIEFIECFLSQQKYQDPTLKGWMEALRWVLK